MIDLTVSDKHFLLELPDVEGTFWVTRAKGREGINMAYHFDVNTVTTADDGFAPKILGAAATLIM